MGTSHRSDPTGTRAVGKLLIRTFCVAWAVGAWPLSGVLVVSVLSGLLSLPMVWLPKGIVNGVADPSGSSFDPLLLGGVYCVLLLVLRLTSGSLSVLEDVLRERVLRRCDHLVAKRVSGFWGLSEFDDAEAQDRIYMAAQGSRAMVTTIVRCIWVLQHALTAVVTLGVTMSLHLLAPLAILVPMIPLLVQQSRAERRIASGVQALSEDRRRLQYYTELALGEAAAKEVRLFRLSDYILQLYVGLGERIICKVRKLRQHATTRTLLLGMPAAAGVGALYFWVVLQVSAGRLTVGDLVLFSGALFYAQVAIRGVGSVAGEVVGGLEYLQRFFELVDESPRTAVTSLLAAPVEKNADISLKDVSFTYPGSNRAVLDRITLRIGPGEHVALVGPNGAGKTTLVKLLLRFYDPENGSITLNGRDLRLWPIQDLRRQFTVVFQDFQRYQLPVRDNIMWSDWKRTDDATRVAEAAAAAGVLDLIGSLPDGWDTVLGKQFGPGVELSGGEWQKIAIARTFFREAPIVIMDEPTAALDAKSEATLLAALEVLAQGRTAIIITHRLTCTRFADRIVVLDHGCVVEDGTHDQLLQQKGLYHSLYISQATQYQ